MEKAILWVIKGKSYIDMITFTPVLIPSQPLNFKNMDVDSGNYFKLMDYYNELKQSGVEKVAVKSSTISEVEYDSEKRELFVTFKNGKKYKYSDVTQSWFRRMVEAESVGKFFSMYIKGMYVTELVS